MPDVLSIVLDALNAFEDTIKAGDRDWPSYPPPAENPDETLRTYLQDIKDASYIISALIPGPRLTPAERRAALTLLDEMTEIAETPADNPDSVKLRLTRDLAKAVAQRAAGAHPATYLLGRLNEPGISWDDNWNLSAWDYDPTDPQKRIVVTEADLATTDAERLKDDNMTDTTDIGRFAHGPYRALEQARDAADSLIGGGPYTQYSVVELFGPGFDQPERADGEVYGELWAVPTDRADEFAEAKHAESHQIVDTFGYEQEETQE